MLASAPVERSSSAKTSQPVVEQQLAQMGADEAGAAGDEGLPDHGGEGYRSMG